MTSPTGYISRADLLRLIDGTKLDEREALAALVGYERRPSNPITSVTISETIRFNDKPLELTPEPEAERRPTIEAPIFWRVISQRRLPEPEIADETIPLWARNWLSNREPAVRIPSGEAPEEISLLYWPRVLGFLRMHLGL